MNAVQFKIEAMNQEQLAYWKSLKAIGQALNSKRTLVIELQNDRPGVPDSSIAEFERATGIRLPRDYREFLKIQNGGKPKRRNVRFGNEPYQDTVLRSFLGIDAPFSFDLKTIVRQYSARIPSLTIPIAKDEFDNLILMSRRRGTTNQVLFWDHEQELKENQPVYVAANLREFLGMLEDDEVVDFDIATITFANGDVQRRVLPFRFFSVDRNRVVEVQSLMIGENVADFGVIRTIAKIAYTQELSSP